MVRWVVKPKIYKLELLLVPKGPSRRLDKRVEENRRALDEMTGDIEHSKNIYGAECTRKTARAECKNGGGGACLGKEVCKVDVAGLEVDVLRETRRRGL